MELRLEGGELGEGLEALVFCVHFPRTCVAAVALLGGDYICAGSIARIVELPGGIQLGAERTERGQTIVSTVVGGRNTHQ